MTEHQLSHTLNRCLRDALGGSYATPADYAANAPVPARAAYVEILDISEVTPGMGPYSVEATFFISPPPPQDPTAALQAALESCADLHLAGWQEIRSTGTDVDEKDKRISFYIQLQFYLLP